MDNQNFVPPSNSQITPPNYSVSKKPLLLVSFLLILSLIIILLLVFKLFFSNYNSSIPSSNLSPTPIAKISQQISIISTQIPSLVPSPTPEQKVKIVYNKKGNIWLVNSDGTGVRQLTTDGDDLNLRYSVSSLKNESEILFYKCSSPDFLCEVFSKNLIEGTEKMEFNPQKRISSLVFNANNNSFFYIGSDTSGNSSLYIHGVGPEKELLKFKPILGRGGSLDDEISLANSPDHKYLLLVNTLTQPNFEDDKTTIWVFDSMGNNVLTIAKEFATHAYWESNNSFIYQDGQTIFRKKISGEEEQVSLLTGSIGSISKDKQYLFIWDVQDNGEVISRCFNIISYEIVDLKNNASYPVLLNNDKLVAIKTAADVDSYLGFITKGLVIYDLAKNSELILDSSESISKFIIAKE